MARYHYTRENENGVVLYLESEPAEDAMDEFDDEIAVGFSGNGYLRFWTRCRRAAEALPNGLKYAAGGRCVITAFFGKRGLVLQHGEDDVSSFTLNPSWLSCEDETQRCIMVEIYLEP